MSIKQLFEYAQPMVAAATILTAGAVIATTIGSYTAYGIKTAADTVEVTGSAKEAVEADYARLVINLDTTTPIDGQQAGLDRLTKASEKITDLLTKQGFTDLESPAAQVNAQYIYPERSAPIQTGYTANRQIIVRSNDTDKVAKLANEIGPLTGTGYNVSTQGLELTYQKLNEMRVKLLTQAIKDAQARAEAIAKESGRSVGTLRSSSSGIVQVLSEGSVDISDYGTYDTQSKRKEVMVTVRATFSLQ
jgi:uncharacterized protein